MSTAPRTSVSQSPTLIASDHGLSPPTTAPGIPGLWCFLAALTLLLASTAALALVPWWDDVLAFVALGYVLVGLVAFVGMIRSALAQRPAAASGIAAPSRSTKALSKVFAGSLLLFLFGFGSVAAFVAALGSGRGRQLRRGGKVLLPPVKRGAAWTISPLAPSAMHLSDDGALPRTARAALAAQWRENGRTEHASVAAFARLSLDLAALGAPPRLLADANRDALDEIRHAELCFGLAHSLDGQAMSPGPFPAAAHARTLPRSRTLALARLAVDSLIDGALHEGMSARVIARLAKRCEDPAVAAMMREIAADESRHAAHGWDVTAWCLSEGGEGVAAALRGGAWAIPKRMRSTVDEAAADGAWERHGIPGRELEAEEYARAHAMLDARLSRLLARRAVTA